MDEALTCFVLKERASGHYAATDDAGNFALMTGNLQLAAKFPTAEAARTALRESAWLTGDLWDIKRCHVAHDVGDEEAS